MVNRIKVLIADDHAVVRDGIRRILEDEPDVEVVGEARDGHEAIDKALDLRPDVVIMDVAMPDVNGLVATRQITTKNAAIRVLGLTVYESPDYFFSMLEAGASGHLLKKDATSAELMAAIHAVHQDGVYLHPTVSKWLIRDRLSRDAPGQKRKLVEELTAREEEILKLVAEGHSNQAIAELLYLSPATVQTHRANIMQKLGLHSRVDLVKYALARGLIHLAEYP
ncbi:MAG: response regulator transcription factor [Chloroflexi bacterium]|nr:response regulator transcription factor [Chloroflexota bacterium]